MCGIAGVFNYKTGAPADHASVAHMTAAISHRGPDDHGILVDGPLGLGHRRLAILDLSDRGHQPMTYADGRFVTVYNGEIYNYVELRQQLQQDGCSFRSDSDTEVLLALYSRHGERCVEKLNGMFAFAIWDSADRRLFIARDRVGIKPLYYTDTKDGLVFASEAKALFRYPGVAADVDADLIPTYMAFGYVPGDRTLFRNVRKLKPGHHISVSPAGQHVREYWDVEYKPNHARSIDQTAEELRALLLDAMRLHLRSDVPVGVFLSGGVDSSASVALLAEAGITGVKTFSVAYREGNEFDESHYARLVATHYRTEHHVLYVDPTSFVDRIPTFVWHMDEPVAEAAAISLYCIAGLLRQHVTVAISGEGSDELFAGYQIYQYMQWIETLRRLPKGLRTRLLEPILAAVGWSKALRYARLANVPLEQRYFGVSLPDTSLGDQLMAHDAATTGVRGAGEAALAVHYARSKGHDLLTRMLYSDLKSWLVDDLLIKADKMTMATAVELRVPFLDHRVVEFAATIPSSLKLRRGKGKWILKKAMAGRLPDEILRRPKLGFPTPLALMFKRDLSSYVRDTLLSRGAASRGYFDQRHITALVDEHLAGTRDHHRTLWQLLVLEEWHRTFVDTRRAHAVPA